MGEMLKQDKNWVRIVWKQAGKNNKSYENAENPDPEFIVETEPWFKSRLHTGRTCMKGTSFWYSANSSVKYWLQEITQHPEINKAKEGKNNDYETASTKQHTPLNIWGCSYVRRKSSGRREILSV